MFALCRRQCTESSGKWNQLACAVTKSSEFKNSTKSSDSVLNKNKNGRSAKSVAGYAKRSPKNGSKHAVTRHIKKEVTNLMQTNVITATMWDRFPQNKMNLFFHGSLSFCPPRTVANRSQLTVPAFSNHYSLNGDGSDRGKFQLHLHSPTRPCIASINAIRSMTFLGLLLSSFMCPI